MSKKELILSSHLCDLANKCYWRDISVHSDFLNLNEQDIFSSIMDKMPPVNVTWIGGYEAAERKIIYFSPLGVCGITQTPLCVVNIRPLNAKFADKLNHRDYLGAILNLGIERGKIGDILVLENECNVICLDSISDFIIGELPQIRHTRIKLQKKTIAHPEPLFESTVEADIREYVPQYEEIKGTVASLRLDAILSLAFHTSRSKIVPYIEGEKVYINSKNVTSNSYILKDGDIVSVRGLGKFKFEESLSETKKGRVLVLLKKYV